MNDTVLSGSLALAAPIALAAGLLSFFSPCVVPLLPGYLSYMTGVAVQDLDAGRRGRMLAGSVLFVLGFTAVFVSFGTFFGEVGYRLLEHQRALEAVLGVVVIVVGLAFAGWIPLLQREARVHAVPRVGVAVAPLLGAGFGLGWIPCISPALLAVLSLSASEASAGRGALLTVIYCLGLGIPFVVAALAFGRFTKALVWVRRHQRTLSVVGGLLMVAVGALLVSGGWGWVVDELRSGLGTGEIAL